MYSLTVPSIPTSWVVTMFLRFDMAAIASFTVSSSPLSFLNVSSQSA